MNINSTRINSTKLSLIDTSKIAILPLDTANHLFLNAIPLQISDRDIQVVDELLNDCIDSNNRKQDTTKRFSEYINLKNYKRQYIPFLTLKGEKEIYINCFCISDADDFDYWKKSLVEVEDGGQCFFHVTINLTSKRCEYLYINGRG